MSARQPDDNGAATLARKDGGSTATQLFAWQGFELHLPSEWECVRFSKNRARGDCSFSDRGGPRLTVLWSDAPANAEIARFVDEAAGQLKKSDPGGSVGAGEGEWRAPGAWRGFRWEGGDGAERLTIALLHVPEARRMFQMQFYERKKLDAPIHRRVLESLRCQPAKSAWRWSAFGCRLLLPGEFQLTACEALAGRFAMTFEIRGFRGQRFSAERLAFPEQQLKGRTLKDWCVSGAGGVREVLQFRERMVRGHAAAEFQMRPKRVTPLHWLARIRRQRSAVAWICEREQRLYRAEWEGPGKTPDLDAMLECC